MKKIVVILCLIFVYLSNFSFVQAQYFGHNLERGLSVTGKIHGSEEVRIVVTASGDTILDIDQRADFFSLPLELRTDQRIDFFSHDGKKKSLHLINFAYESEIIIYDVDFRSSKSLILIKYNYTDREGKFIETLYIPSPSNWKPNRINR